MKSKLMIALLVLGVPGGVHAQTIDLGDMLNRGDRAPRSSEEVRRDMQDAQRNVDDAQRRVEDVMRAAPSREAQDYLNSARGRLSDARHDLRRADDAVRDMDQRGR